jgi:hypothetical protein
MNMENICEDEVKSSQKGSAKESLEKITWV